MHTHSIVFFCFQAKICTNNLLNCSFPLSFHNFNTINQYWSCLLRFHEQCQIWMVTNLSLHPRKNLGKRAVKDHRRDKLKWLPQNTFSLNNMYTTSMQLQQLPSGSPLSGRPASHSTQHSIAEHNQKFKWPIDGPHADQTVSRGEWKCKKHIGRRETPSTQTRSPSLWRGGFSFPIRPGKGELEKGLAP